jgi:hypothetical protein
MQALEAQNRALDGLKTSGRRFPQLDLEQNPDLKSWILIRIKVKSWIRIRIKVMRLGNPDGMYKYWTLKMKR